jgi:hypothetical protein
MVDIKAYPGYISIRSPFNRGFVDGLKLAIPTIYRAFNGEDKTWLVANDYVGTALQLVARCYNAPGFHPNLISQTIRPVHKEIRLRYIGSTKEEHGASGEEFALGMVGNEWPLIFSRDLLESFFEGKDFPDPTQQAPKKKGTLYTVLAISNTATEEELKKAYRRMALQWHPDTCKEPDAQDRFIEIQAAYEVLKDSDQRKRYDIALRLEASSFDLDTRASVRRVRIFAATGYRTPLRNGILKVECHDFIKRLMIDRILAWDDVVDEHGRTLIASWKMGDKQPTEVWF